MLNLNSVMISSEDPKPLHEFYTKIFGKPVWDQGGFQSFMAGDGALTVGPHDKVKGKNKEPGRILVFFETSDVKGEFERIKGLGAKVVAEPYNPDEASEMQLATFEDPDGNYFQLASPWEP